MPKCGRCRENLPYCLCDGGAGNKNTPPLVKKALIAEYERDEALENQQQWQKKAMLLEEQLADQHQRDRLDVASRIAAGIQANPDKSYDPDGLAIDSIKCADALLAEWERTGKNG